LKTRQAPLLLAVILAAPAFAFADNIPGHSRTGNNYVSFSEGLMDQQDSQGSSARCNFLLSSIKENGSKSISFGKDAKDANLGTYLSTGMGSNAHPVQLVDFGADQGASSDKDKGKDPVKHHGGDGDGNGSGVGSAAPSSVIGVAEPGSESLLLFGLAAVGMLFYRRRTLMEAI
jgi:PEP-CTERM motif